MVDTTAQHDARHHIVQFAYDELADIEHCDGNQQVDCQRYYAGDKAVDQFVDRQALEHAQVLMYIGHRVGQGG